MSVSLSGGRPGEGRAPAKATATCANRWAGWSGGTGARRGVAARGAGAGGGGGAGGAGGGGGGGGGGGAPGGAEGGGFSLASMWAAYLAANETNPLRTKAITGGVLNALGDLIAQAFFTPDANGWDAVRTLKFTFLGVVLVAPALHFWYGALNKLVPQPGPAATVLRVALDQFGFAPLFIATFLSSLFTINGQAAAVPAKLSADWWNTCKTNWLIWIPFQVVNFGVVPPNLQVAAANVCALVWNTYLSWAGTRKVEN